MRLRETKKQNHVGMKEVKAAMFVVAVQLRKIQLFHQYFFKKALTSETDIVYYLLPVEENAKHERQRFAS